jgi:hydrogenase-4 component B
LLSVSVGSALVAAGHDALPATIAVLLVLSFASAVVGVSRWNPRALSLTFAALGSLAIVALGLVAVAGGTPVNASAGNVLGFAVVQVRYDALAGLFLVALGTVGIASSVFGIGYEASGHAGADRTRAAYPVFLASLALVFGANDAFAFLLAWELMALSSAVLVVGARPSPEVARTGYLYLALTHLATAALIVAFALLAAAAGSTDLASFGTAAGSMSPETRSVVFVLLLIGFGTKAGAIPLHVWLPRAHPVAPSHVSALMSGVMVKAGIYGLVRFAMEILGPGPEWWGLLVLGVGLVSAVLGILYALMEHDLKRLLAFSSIENVGIILVGVGIAMLGAGAGSPALAALGLTAALLHTLNHALFKSALFLAAGSIQSAAGSRDLNVLGGLARAMPMTALALGLGAAAISGLPPLNGFASEWLTFQGLIGAGSDAALSQLVRAAALVAVGGLGLTVALSLAAFVKATGMSLLALPRSAGAAAAREVPPLMRGAAAGLALACVVAGVAAGPLAGGIAQIAGPAVGQAPDAASIGAAVSIPGQGATYGAGPLAGLLGVLLAAAWLGTRRSRRTRRVATWTTGIAPEAKFEYTATSYAKLIRLYFGPVLRPEREVTVELHPGTPFPRAVRYRGRVRHVVDERLYRPLHAIAVAAAELIRRLQSGSLQRYLAYSVTALVVLLLVARA